MVPQQQAFIYSCCHAKSDRNDRATQSNFRQGNHVFNRRTGVVTSFRSEDDFEAPLTCVNRRTGVVTSFRSEDDFEAPLTCE